MEYKIFNNLNEAINAKMIREKVFIDEQGFEIEFDDIDNISLHLEVYEEGKAVGCARMYSYDNKEYILGRIAVLKEYRGLNYGSYIISVLEDEVKNRGGNKIVLSAQVRASQFYEKAGYQKVGEEYLDEYCPHIRMIKMI